MPRPRSGARLFFNLAPMPSIAAKIRPAAEKYLVSHIGNFYPASKINTNALDKIYEFAQNSSMRRMDINLKQDV